MPSRKYDLNNDADFKAFVAKCFKKMKNKDKNLPIKNEYYIKKYMENNDWYSIECEIRSMGWDIYVDIVNNNEDIIEDYEELDSDFSSDLRFSLDDAMYILNCANEDIKLRIDDAIEGGVDINLYTTLQKNTFNYYNRPENAEKKKALTQMAIKKMTTKYHKQLMNDDFYNVIFETKRYIIKRPIKQQ